MQYPIFIHKDPDSDYGVTIPDLPGCYSAGSSLEEAIQNAKEAIECHLEGLFLDAEDIPLQKSIEKHFDDPDLRGAVVAVVEIDLSKVGGRSKRIDITLPERLLRQIERYTKTHGLNRSAFLADAAMNYMAEHSTKNHNNPTEGGHGVRG